MTKICNTCKDELYIKENFPVVNNKISNKCWNCTREYHTSWRKLTRERNERKIWKMP